MNLFEMYVANDCKFGFHVTRDSWGNGKYAMFPQLQVFAKRNAPWLVFFPPPA